MQEQAPARRHALVVAADARRPSVRAVAPRYHDGFQFRTSGPTNKRGCGDAHAWTGAPSDAGIRAGSLRPAGPTRSCPRARHRAGAIGRRTGAISPTFYTRLALFRVDIHAQHRLLIRSQSSLVSPRSAPSRAGARRTMRKVSHASQPQENPHDRRQNEGEPCHLHRSDRPVAGGAGAPRGRGTVWSYRLQGRSRTLRPFGRGEVRVLQGCHKRLQSRDMRLRWQCQRLR